ncbi:hypothetical protein J7L68_02990 [bacterium]|nr:hypothetical protein [bacterium]
MALEIYHQLGHNAVWNFDSIRDDNTGDGVIISPRHIKRSKIEAYPVNTRNRAIFDPQFFLPREAFKKLTTYEFFPANIANEFETNGFIESHANDCAEACVNFQIENGFRFITIPTRYLPGMPSDFSANLEKIFIRPHITALNSKTNHNQVLLEIIVNQQMINDAEYQRDLLNWLTGLDGIDGIYLILERPSNPKQFQDENTIYNYLRFINAIKLNDMFLVMGYLGLESLVYSIASPDIVTIGTFENTRVFQIDSFAESETDRRGPRPRVYFSKLIQSIDHGLLDAFSRRLDDYNELLDHNGYQVEMFQPEFKWHFTKSAIYKHHLLEFSTQLRNIAELDGRQRFERVTEMINIANDNFRRISEAGIPLDIDSGGNHLNIWLTAMNEFAQDQGWR